MGLISRVSSRTYRENLKMSASYSMSRYPIQPVKIQDELTCDCSKNCASHGPEYQQFHDCEIIEELFKQISTINLQKLYVKSDYMNNIRCNEYNNGGIDIIISCIPKTVENGGKTNEEVLHEFKMKRYDEIVNDSIESDEKYIEHDYVDADTGLIVPFPETDDTNSDSSLSDPEEERKRKRRKRRREKRREDKLFKELENATDKSLKTQ